MRRAISRLERRLVELKGPKLSNISNSDDPTLAAMQAAIKQTLESSFGIGTTEYETYKDACKLNQTGWGDVTTDRLGNVHSNVAAGIARGRDRAIALLEQAVRSLTEELADCDEGARQRPLRAYDGLDLHPEIARAASGLYRDGHYANAIENAVKALNSLVRLRSGRDDLDGTSLMETVFSPKGPILKFNEMSDQSDRDEQKGFMMMFSGAVSGLRNPRAHKLIQDDPERALEFIAYISLLAKLLDSSK